MYEACIQSEECHNYSSIIYLRSLNGTWQRYNKAFRKRQKMTTNGQPITGWLETVTVLKILRYFIPAYLVIYTVPLQFNVKSMGMGKPIRGKWANSGAGIDKSIETSNGENPSVISEICILQNADPTGTRFEKFLAHGAKDHDVSNA